MNNNIKRYYEVHDVSEMTLWELEDFVHEQALDSAADLYLQNKGKTFLKASVN